MLLIRSLVLCGISLAAASCALHPLPEDVTGYNTSMIVRKIRCEAREAIRKHTKKALEDRGYGHITAQLTDDNATWKKHRYDFPPPILALLDKYDNTAIAYDFTFDITERGTATAGVDFLRTLTRGTFNLGVRAGGELDRENNRNFLISDTFENLVLELPQAYCENTQRGQNWTYPISGKIGLEELIGTFLDLNERGNLGVKDKVHTMADTIRFRTKISGGATPRVELSPVGPAFQFVKANLIADASREDIHKVLVSLSLPVDEPPPKTVAARAVVARAPVIARGRAEDQQRTGAERRAVREIYEQRDRQFYNRFEQFQRRIENQIID
jgi:hypothetical protein